MLEKEVTKKIYVADDNKEFLSKEECEKYETFVTLIPQHYYKIFFLST